MCWSFGRLNRDVIFKKVDLWFFEGSFMNDICFGVEKSIL